jgi:hypothetical protein
LKKKILHFYRGFLSLAFVDEKDKTKKSYLKWVSESCEKKKSILYEAPLKIKLLRRNRRSSPQKAPSGLPIGH